MGRLFVIEAPNKARTLEAMLEKLGFPARVQATVGHILNLPDKLDPIGIDRIFRDFDRKPRDIKIVERLRAEAQLADEVFVATDADAEGDVIAWDVATLIADLHPAPRRVKLKGMDSESVRLAIELAGPVRKSDAVGGRTRAIVDRLIGAGFSKDGVAVGRVSTAMLGLVARQRPSPLRLRLVAPADDGGRPWSAEADVGGPIDAAMAETLAGLTLPKLRFFKVDQLVVRPGHMGDIMVRAGDRLDLSPKEGAASLQKLYEAGRMSYPRAGARGITPEVARKMEAMLRKAGYKVDAGKYPPKGDADVHDAPHPIGPVEANRDPEKLGHDEGVRTMVARDMVKSGLAIREERPTSMNLVPWLVNKGHSPAVAQWVADMPWRREVGPMYPGKETYPESAVERRRPDTVLLERAVAAGLGRPSTWANHVETFMNRGLVDENLALTAKGRNWVAKSPPDLLDPRISAAIERACEDVREPMMNDPAREPWEINAERIVRALPPAVKGVCMGLIADVPAHAMADPIADYGFAESAIEAAEAAAALPRFEPRARGDY